MQSLLPQTLSSFGIFKYWRIPILCSQIKQSCRPGTSALQYLLYEWERFNIWMHLRSMDAPLHLPVLSSYLSGRCMMMYHRKEPPPVAWAIEEQRTWWRKTMSQVRLCTEPMSRWFMVSISSAHNAQWIYGYRVKHILTIEHKTNKAIKFFTQHYP
jgi:hypothetical protein